MLITKEGFRDSIAGKNGDAIASALRELERRSPTGYAHLILSDEGQTLSASAGRGVDERSGERLNIGCIGKLISASTLLIAMENRLDQLDQPVCELLKVPCDDWRSEITVRHLLNHSHGLDEPPEWRRPTRSDGFTDARAIFAGVGTFPLAPVGRHFSYSNVGSWLVAAAVEALTGMRYTDTVRNLFLGVMQDEDRSLELCPATGRGASLHAVSLLRMAVSIASGKSTGRSLESHETSLHEGWHPAEIGVCLGWKAYRNGWYGYKSAPPGAPNIMLRVNPSERIGFLAWSFGLNSWEFIRDIFSHDMVETPGRMVGTVGSRISTSRAGPPTPGIYYRVDSTIDVRCGASEARAVVTTKMKDPRRSMTCEVALRPLHNGLYMVSPAVPQLNLSVVQFMGDGAGDSSHLWNTGRLWRRLVK